MSRKRIKLAWIVNNVARRTSLKKRSSSLLKKVSELATLCGVEASAIIYSPNEREPKVWPSLESVVVQILGRFEGLPESEREKKMLNQDSYIRETIFKLQNYFTKLKKKINEVEITHLMSQLEQGKQFCDFSPEEQQKMALRAREKIKELWGRMEFRNQEQIHHPLPPQSGGNNGLGCDEWFVNIMNQRNGVGSSTKTNQIGLPNDLNVLDDQLIGENYFNLNNYMGLPVEGTETRPAPSERAAATELGSIHQIIGMSTFGCLGGSDAGLPADDDDDKFSH